MNENVSILRHTFLYVKVHVIINGEVDFLRDWILQFNESVYE